MLRKLQRLAVGASVVAFGDSVAWGASCANPNALGVSRTISVNSRLTPLVGRHDYGVTLPLARGEVVLTFDDGPRAPYTNRVLKTLADECLRATFFVVGRQSLANPHLLRTIRAAGHTIGTHTQNHPLTRMRGQRIAAEIDGGIASARSALGSPHAVAPFFRFPGLFRSYEAESYLRRRGIMAWSIDVDSYDWKGLGVEALVRHTMAHLERRGGGILLMHDANAGMARALPRLIVELKRRGFRIVHVVPSASSPVLVAENVPPRPVKKVVAPRPGKPIARRVEHRKARTARHNKTVDVTFTTGFRPSRR